MSKIWQKWSTDQINKMVENYTVWVDYLLDLEIINYDLKASKAHAKMLCKIWILNEEEKNILLKWLSEIQKLVKNNKFIIEKEDEDCHSAIEKYLTLKYWEVWKKIHTWRSRNDQILVAMRLFSKDKVWNIKKLIKTLIKSFEEKILEIWETKMPGYTHTQKAMPTTVWTWLWSIKDALKDDLILLDAALKVNDQNPLWSVAWFWEDVFWLDRDFVSQELWFKKTQENPMYSAYSRWKFENIILQALSQIMMDLWKLSNDLVIFSAKEFDFFDLPDSFKTWSSVMPQKKNWDIMELLRWNSNLFLWYEYQVKEIFKNLLSWYNRDFQLTKEPYLKWIKLVIDSVEITNLTIQNLTAKKENLEKACTKELYATQEAYKLVKSWMTFRDAYKIVWEKYL
jgi:argininosuccinate lyase